MIRAGGASRTVAATGLVVTGVAAAMVMGVLVVERPATLVPLTIELVLLAFLTRVFVWRIPEPHLRRWVGRMTLAAVVVRVAVLFVVHFVLAQEFFAPDVLSYERQGRALAAFWRGVGPDPELRVGTQLIYPYLNGAFAYVFGDPTFGVVILNLFAGIWTVLLTFVVGRELLGERVGRMAAFLAAFFPSLVLWSVLNVRDSLTTLGVVATVYFGLRLYRAGRLSDLAGAALAVIFLVGLRDYMGFLLLLGLVLGAVSLLGPGRVGNSLAVGTVFALALVFAVEQLGLFQRVVTESPLEQAQQLRIGLQQDFGGGAAGSSFGMGYDTSTVSGALRFLPIGLAYFLLAPFPWALDSVLQLVTLPEVLLWYAMVPFTVMGLWLAPKRGRPQVFVVVAILIVVVTSYALVEGNVGTAYRHRAQVMPLFFVFTAVGLIRVRQALEERRHARAERVRRARTSLRQRSG